MSKRIRILDGGGLEIVDPGLESLDLLQSLDPLFRVRRAPLLGFGEPRFLSSRLSGCGIAKELLPEQPEDFLWKLHRKAMEIDHGKNLVKICMEGEASILDLKIEISKRLLKSCRLCAHRCEVDRLAEKRGICGLGTEAIVAEHFVHIAEEAPVNPSLVLSLAGCGLRCSYCQQWRILNPKKVQGNKLDVSLWEKLDWNEARSIQFVGGNPDESLYAILQFLAGAPATWKLPVVWNTHGYCTPETLDLLNGVVDVFLPDFKYGKGDCARNLSGAPDYFHTAKTTIAQMLNQNIPVIVRVLVLPGHFDCCHKPVLEALKGMTRRENLTVSIRGQYSPDFRITKKDGIMARRPFAEEVQRVRSMAMELELVTVEEKRRTE